MTDAADPAVDANVIKDLDLVALLVDLPADGVRRGHVGTIVYVHKGGIAFEVEFPFGPRRSVVTTVEREKLLRLDGLDARMSVA